jgi:hypothetical protein
MVRYLMRGYIYLGMMVIALILTVLAINHCHDIEREPVTLTINEKFCTNAIFAQGCYITDNSKKTFISNGYYPIRDYDTYKNMEIGKTYICYNYVVSFTEIADINPNHKYLQCEEMVKQND